MRDLDVDAALTYFHELAEEMAAVRERRDGLEAEARDAGAKTIGDLKALEGSDGSS